MPLVAACRVRPAALDPPHQIRLRRLIAELGVVVVAGKLGLGREAVARLGAGFLVKRGTLVLAIAALDALDAAATTAPKESA